jgi:hypothetical protein
VALVPEDDQDPESSLTEPPSSAEKSDGKPRAKKSKGKGKGKKRAAAESETAEGSEPKAKRSRRNKGSVDYKEKTIDDL